MPEKTIRTMFEIEWKIMKFIVETLKSRPANEHPGVLLDDIAKHCLPMPVLHYITLLMEFGVIEEPQSLNGHRYKNRFQTTDRGDYLYEQYSTGKETPQPNPSLPVPRGVAGANKTPMLNTIAGPSEIGPGVNHAVGKHGGTHASTVVGLGAANSGR